MNRQTFPLTETQLGMYLEWNADRASTQYNNTLDSRFAAGTVDADRLAEAVRAVLNHYPVFHLRFAEQDGEVVQFVAADRELAVERRTAAEADMPRVRRTFLRPFDPFSEPMARAAVVTTESATHLLVDLFHLLSDGTTYRRFNEVLAAAYAGESLPAEDMEFTDYALLEPTLFESEAYAAAKADHAARFAGKAMTVPEGDGESAGESAADALISVCETLPRAEIEAFCRAQGVHPNLFFMGAFSRTLALYANASEAVFFTANHGRRDPRLRRSLGAFVKSVPVLATLDGEKTLPAFLNSLKLHKAGDYPFTHFCRDLGMKPGFAYVFQDGTVDLNIRLGETVAASEIYGAHGVGRLPTLEIGGDADGFELKLSVLPGAYSAAWCRTFVARIAEVARQFLAHPDARLRDIPVVSETEAAELVALARGKDLACDASATFIDLFARSAAAHGERTAVVDCEGAMTYAELDAASSALAATLAAKGVKPGDFVALKLPRRKSFLVSALAAMKAGAGYVPIDPEYPADRIAYMVDDSQAKVVVDETFILGVNDSPLHLHLSPTPSSPAYMIYTSGSTGRPKGVVIPQRALVALCAWATDEFGLDPDSRMGVTASFSFDASVLDLFPSLTVGGAVHIFSETLRKDLAGMRAYAEKERMTGWTMSTQLGLAMLNAYPDVPLKLMLVGGEKILPFAKTNVKVYNGYGPTEFTVASSFQVVDQSAEGEVPIGRPVPNSCSFLCDRFGQLVPRGMVGEICLAGVQIADGYWRQREKTEKAFVAIPFPLSAASASSYPRMYRTGDYGCYDGAGRLLYRGRIDFQVKLRGFRIEIGEIEHVAASFPGVAAVAAEVRTLAGTQHLVLYYEGSREDEGGLKAFLASRLTGYMVPDYFVRLEKMPLTPVGKIDRKHLPDPELSDEPVVAPASDAETKILSIVQSVLKTDKVGVTHDLTRAGLTSLGAMSLVAKLKKEAGFAVTLSQLAKCPTVRSLAESLAGASPASAPRPAAGRRPKRATYPMTENQRGVYADWLREPQGTAYNIPFVLSFAKTDPERLAEAVRRTIDAHPALKTRFVEKDGEIVQQRRDDAEIAIARETLDHSPDSAYFAALVKPFAPQDADLVRAHVVSHPGGATLFLDAHHTVSDGVSAGVFLADLMKALDGKPLAGEAMSAFDAALQERDYLESELVQEDEEWFARYLDGCESTSVESFDPPAAVPAGTVARVATRLPAAAIARRTGELGVSASDFLLGAFLELLRRTGRSDDVQIAFVSAGRGDPDLANAIGMFVKTLPVRNVKDEPTFSGMVRRLRDRVLEIRDRDRASYARLAAANGLKSEVIFAYEGGLFDLPEGISMEAVPGKTAKFPLSVTVTPGRDDFELAFEYDAARYGERMMRQLLEMFATLAAGAAETDTLREIPLVDAATAADLRARAYGGDLAYDETKTFLSLFASNVRTRSFATAVVDAAGAMTYGELDAASDALAATLAAKGVKPGEFVVVKLGRVKEFVVAAIGIMKAGAAYVPVDPAYPAERIAYMVEDSQAKVVVDEAFVLGVEDDSSLHLHLSPAPSSPAYMIYTSGSTGRPKGVVIPHRALRHMLAWAVRDCEITYRSKALEHASFSFDASVISIFPALAAGGEVHILAEELRKDLPGMRDYIVKNGITSTVMSTQIGMALIDAYPDLPLHDIMFGGEKLLPIAKTKVKLFNGYGPTEFTVASSCQVVDQEAEGDIPIGRAVAGTWSLVVDRYGQLLPHGFAGEIALEGPQIADGYWRQDEKTAKVFVGGRYRTGDLAKYDEQDRLVYLGRLDFQVKLRGFRIETGEIEHVASTFPGIGAVAAEVRDVGGAKHLVLYYEGRWEKEEGSDREGEGKLKEFLASRLTEYMVPDYFVEMDRLPLTPVGKIDRRQLKSPSADAAPQAYVEPANATERAIAEAYAGILKLERFGATDDFFQSGGTSILAIKAVVALQKAGLDVQYGDLFKRKTPRALAAFITGEAAPSTSNLQPSTSAFGDYDYTAIDALLAKTRTDLFKGFRVHSLGDVLLTGATGYLGIHVLRHLLEKTSSSVTVLLRPKGKTGPERRLDAQYVYYFGERIPRAYRDRVAYVPGDITDADLAAKLAGVDAATVINCAALVKHYIADDALDRVNVKGVENLIAWCAESGARFVQTSTYSVGGMVGAADPARLDERRLYVGQGSDNDYIRTKFLAERAVLAAVAAGKVRAKVMRLGNLMGREADGEFQMNVGANAFVNSLKSYKAIGAYPLEELAAPLEMSPIDRVAEAVCLLATTPDDMVVFHPYNAYALDMGAVLGALNRRGYAVDFVSRDDFAARVDALRNDPRHAGELQGILHYAQRHLGGERPTPVANAWTTTALYRLGFRWKPAEDRYLANFFDMLDGLAVFG